MEINKLQPGASVINFPKIHLFCLVSSICKFLWDINKAKCIFFVILFSHFSFDSDTDGLFSFIICDWRDSKMETKARFRSVIVQLHRYNLSWWLINKIKIG